MKKIINPVEVIKISIQWFIRHMKTMVVIALSYLGVDKILEDMALDTMSYGNYHGTAKEFFSTLAVDGLMYLGMMLLVYVIICVVSITLDKRPLTMNAISLYLKRNTRGVIVAIGFIVMLGLVGKYTFQWISDAIGIHSEYMLFVIAGYGALGILFAFIPHELMINNQGGFQSVRNSLKKTVPYYGKLFVMHLFLTFLFLINRAIIDWLLGGFFERALATVNIYVFISMNAIALTVFYHKIIRD